MSVPIPALDAAPGPAEVEEADATAEPPFEPEGSASGWPHRLSPPMPADGLWGWLGPLLVTLLAGVLRFSRLSVPKTRIFDETYYAKDAWSLLHHGVEVDKGVGEFVAHPPLGKWAIALGEAAFGNNSFGWRFSAAVAGTLAVLMLARIARRLFRSTLLGCLAGLLLAVEGLAFVQSRTSMLDIFLMVWVLAAFGCLLLDRDASRIRLGQLGAGERPCGRGPRLGVRWWRLGAGVCLGAACATKWSGLYFLVAFAAMALWWDISARRAMGVRRPLRAALVRDAPALFASVALLAAAVYTASWTGWFLGNGHNAYGHDTYVRVGQPTLQHTVAVVHGWVRYQVDVWRFHDTLTAHHPYQSHPIGWLLLARPVSYYYVGSKLGVGGCAAAGGCTREILAIGTPLIWWSSIAALLATAWTWISRRDWRAGAILLATAAGIVPWAYYDLQRRTEFLFYALPSVPFLILALTLCAGLVLGPRDARQGRRTLGAVLVGGYLVAVLVNFWYCFPILTAQLLPYAQWRHLMWFGSWI